MLIASAVARAGVVVADRRLVNLVTVADEKIRLPSDKSDASSCTSSTHTHVHVLIFAMNAVVCSLPPCIYVMVVPRFQISLYVVCSAHRTCMYHFMHFLLFTEETEHSDPKAREEKNAYQQ